MAEASGFAKSATAIGAADTYLDCLEDRRGGECVRGLFFTAISLAGGGGAGFGILSGPAQGALFRLVDYTTDFATRQFRVIDEAIDAANKGAALRQINRNGQEGPGAVRYWDGLGYWHAKGTGAFWTAASNKED